MLRALGETLPEAARRFGDKTAVVFKGAAYSYTALNAESDRFAAGLVRSGASVGDRVTLYLPNSVAWIVAYFGALKAGAVVNPVNALNTATEVAFIVADCGARFVVTTVEKEAALRAERGLDAALIVVGGDDALSFEALCAVGGDAWATHIAASGDLAAIGYTSGTTGRPKGAMLSHEAIVLNSAMTAQMHMRTERDVTVSALPLPHVYGNVVMNAAFQTGMTLVLHARFVEREILESIETHRATMLEGVPTMYNYLLNSAELAGRDLSSLTRCTVGGQTMPLAKMEEVEARFGCPLIELWGMTELAGLGTTHPMLGKRRLGSIGVALPYCEARIASLVDDAQAAPLGEAGELLFRGPVAMLGYYRNKAATDEAISADGWLRTGDIAHMDSDQCIFIVDRKKEMILTAGYNVYPAELERVIAQHPAVSMVAIGKAPDEDKGEIAKAYVVLRAGAAATEAEILTHCRAGLAAYKVPRAVLFVSDLPKTSTGKILRRELHTLDEGAMR